MIIELNDFLLNNWTQETAYFSFSYSLPERELVALFRQSHAYKGSRFFWLTPDRKQGYVGIGALEKFYPQNPSELATIKQSLFKKLLVTPSEKGLPLLFGSLPFNANGPEETFWEEMEKGYFLLPEILFQLRAAKLQVTLTVKASTKDEAIQQLAGLKEKMNKIFEESTQSTESSPFLTTERDTAYFESLVTETVNHIKEKSFKKVVLARQLQLEGAYFDTETIISNLLKQQPNTYAFVLESATRIFIGATPERLLKATVDTYATASIAGTAPRGKNEMEDRRIGKKLLKDSKNSSEHQIVVERIQKQLAPFIEGEIQATIKKLLKNRDLQHLFIPLKGKRRTNSSFLDVINTLHPTPALGGEPKKAALEWITHKEKRGRGLYGAPVGWLSLTADIGEFAVGIRSGVFSSNQALLYAGCGIVEDSIPEEERKETDLKFQPMIRGVKGI